MPKKFNKDFTSVRVTGGESFNFNEFSKTNQSRIKDQEKLNKFAQSLIKSMKSSASAEAKKKNRERARKALGKK